MEINTDNIKLEDYRKSSLGKVYFQLSIETDVQKSQGYKVFLPDTTDILPQIVINEVKQELKRLENQKAGVISVKTPLIVVEIFSMLEKTISTIQQIISISNYNYKSSSIEEINNNIRKLTKNINKSKFNNKIKDIFKKTDNEIVDFHKTLEYQKLQELVEYRNNYLHGNLVPYDVKSFKHSNAVKQYYFSNFVDIIDALNTAVNIISIFRYIIPKIDLMPQIPVYKNNFLFHKPLDAYFEHVIYKAFCLTLKKLNLKTDYEFIDKPNIKLKTFVPKNKLNIISIMKVKRFEHELKFPQIKSKTNHFEDCMKEFLKNDKAKKGYIQVPKRTVD